MVSVCAPAASVYAVAPVCQFHAPLSMKSTSSAAGVPSMPYHSESELVFAPYVRTCTLYVAAVVIARSYVIDAAHVGRFASFGQYAPRSGPHCMYDVPE